MLKKINWFWALLIFNLFLLTWHFIESKSKLSNSPAFFTSPPLAVAKTKTIPSLSTPYYLIIDPADNQIIAGSRISEKIYPASVTKLATALTALNLYPLDEVITAKAYSIGKTMNLVEGEKVTVNTLVSGLLIFSANDAAFNLADHLSGGTSAFVGQMNTLVKKYGLSNTHFMNFDGLHDPDHYSTLYDLSQIGRLALKLPSIVAAAKTKEASLADLSGQISHHLVSTNELLGKVPEIEGLKTGWTPEASGSFIGLVNINGHYLLTLVAQSQDRFADTAKLVTWAKSNLSWEYRSY
ncbi:MAG: D-alanyl-D-alanine carboxypeptidase [Microgenomates group bacterium GW2011_GWA2_40_6]|nr:MAG: D-alanyl-D-alanine carboxypeptidase [Microgenomates group bacterium GW2011_GWA2_40_6]